MHKLYFFMSLVIITISSLIILLLKIASPEMAISNLPPPSQTLTLPLPTLTPTPTKLPQVIQTKILLDIPFTSQAPFNQWGDPRQQDGCEEAASLMVVAWAQGKNLTKEESLKEILAASEFEEKKLGTYRDTDPQDTVNHIIKDYLGYENAQVQDNITLKDMIREINQGHALIVPINGRIVGNPHYTSPGPERHMIVIKGYDPKTEEFITNDPGTTWGENYRYKSRVLFSAIRVYPTGDHLPIEGTKKSMIVVFPQASSGEMTDFNRLIN